MEKIILNVTEEFIGKRIDIFLQKNISDTSRAFIQKLIDNGNVLINKKNCNKSSLKLKGNEIIEITLPEEEVKEILPENIPLNIVYEDEDIAIINKPAGLTVHPAQDIVSGTLVNGLLFHFKTLANIEIEKVRPGIVHRLDKNTSGLIVIAKTDRASENLIEKFKTKDIKKTYIAICKGNFSEKSGRIENLIGRDPTERKRMAVVEINGKPAISNYQVIDEVQDFSLVKVHIETGRTHQIRVHMKYLNHPILGDDTYGNPSKIAKRQMLHAYFLEFNHPITNEPLKIFGELPDDFVEVAKKLKLNIDIIKENGDDDE